MTRSTSAGPVTLADRVAELDGLRGVALLGVSIANLATSAGWYGLGPEVRAALPTAAVDGTVEFLTHVLADDTFYMLFLLLFGIGFAVQVSRAGVRAEAPGVFERRSGVALWRMTQLI